MSGQIFITFLRKKTEAKTLKPNQDAGYERWNFHRLWIVLIVTLFSYSVNGTIIIMSSHGSNYP